jgi:hypothetical protein
MIIPTQTGWDCYSAVVGYAVMVVVRVKNFAVTSRQIVSSPGITPRSDIVINVASVELSSGSLNTL